MGKRYFRIDLLHMLLCLILVLEVLMIYTGIKEAREDFEKKNQKSIVVKYQK